MAKKFNPKKVHFPNTHKKKKEISINKLILNILNKVFKNENQSEYHDLDDFFGTWLDEEYNTILEVSGELRKIDEELWK